LISLLLAMSIVFTAVGAATPARADVDSDTAAITIGCCVGRRRSTLAMLQGSATCSPDLISTVPEALDGSRDALRGRLSAVLAKPDLQLHYDSPDLREIIVSGDIAIVRLFWTLTAQKGAKSSVSTEAGMDIFKRQPDGKWSIARFISFSATPNKVLQ
jgi:steroid delta-isomerase